MAKPGPLRLQALPEPLQVLPRIQSNPAGERTTHPTLCTRSPPGLCTPLYLTVLLH